MEGAAIQGDPFNVAYGTHMKIGLVVASLLSILIAGILGDID